MIYILKLFIYEVFIIISVYYSAHGKIFTSSGMGYRNVNLNMRCMVLNKYRKIQIIYIIINFSFFSWLYTSCTLVSCMENS